MWATLMNVCFQPSTRRQDHETTHPAASRTGLHLCTQPGTGPERRGQQLKQSFIVDNQGGGGGVIACQATVRAAPDGYTLMQGYVATHGTSPATRKLPYDAVKDFTAIGMIGATPNVLVVNAD